MLFVVLLLALPSAPGPWQPGRVEAQLRDPPVSLSGRLLTDDRKPLVSGTVVMAPGGRESAAVGEARLLPDGTFTFTDVRPGTYVIKARGATERAGPWLYASFAVTVRARDVRDINITLRPGAVIEGDVRFEARHGTPPPPLSSLRVRAPWPDGSTFGDTAGSEVRADGTFTLNGLSAGTHVLVVQGLVHPWRISEARVLGGDAVERTFEVDPGQQVRGVRVRVTDTAAAVSGIVSMPEGLGVSEVLVIAFPADPLRRALPLRFVRAGRPADDGTYRLVDLVPGDYRVVAAVNATEFDALSPDVLERLVAAATPVRLVEAQVSIVPLRAVTTAARPSVP